MSDKKTILFWVDLETTGLNVDGRILEIAVVLTDLELNEIDAFESVVPQDDIALSLMNDYVKDMHTKNGLIQDIQTCPEQGYDFELVKIEEWIIKNMLAAREAENIFVIAGSTVGFDRRWLAKCMPKLESMLHYRQLDVSSYKVGFPEIFGVKTSDAHRAMPDIRASIEMHRRMRAIVLTPRECLQAIVDYEPTEVCKDDFAYDRMVEAYRDAARNGLDQLPA